MNFSDIFKKNIKGHIEMIQYKGNHNNGEIINYYNDHNVITNDSALLMSSLIVPSNAQQIISGTETLDNTGYSYTGVASDYTTFNGLQYIAFGDCGYNDLTDADEKLDLLQNGKNETTQMQEKKHCLINEICNKDIKYWCYLDNNELPTSNLTNKIRLTVLLDSDFINQNLKDRVICEMGTFSENVVTFIDDEQQTYTGHIMFSYRQFPGWKVIADTEMLIHWTFTF